MQIKNRDTGEIIYEDDRETMRETVENAIAVKIKMENVDLRGADLRGCNMNGCRIPYSDFSGCDFRGADLFGAYLRGSRFNGSDFRGCDMREADVTDSDFSYCDLCGADWRDADFDCCDTRTVKWDAEVNAADILNLYSGHRYIMNVPHILNQKMQEMGCRWDSDAKQWFHHDPAIAEKARDLIEQTQQKGGDFANATNETAHEM